MKVLIVDDEKNVQRLFEQRFRKERRNGLIELHFAFSGQEALDFLAQGGDKGLALILSDINMPEMSGLELLQIVRQDYPSLMVVMITAYGDAQNQERAMKLGASDYLVKPIDFKILKERVITN